MTVTLMMEAVSASETIERRGRVVNTPTLYSGGYGFDYQPGDRLP
jgi:hypothetical protein